MRAVVDAKEFSKALDKVSKVLRKSVYVPILGETLVRFSGGRCILRGTDLETWLTTEIPARGDDFAFAFYQTASAVKACRRFDGELILEVTETGEGKSRQMQLCMSCGCRSGEFHAFFPEEYPYLPTLEQEHTFTANAAGLLKRIDRVKYATYKSGQESDAHRSSVQFQDNRIFCLDGFRAAWDTDSTLSVPASFMVPAAPLAYLKLFGNADVSVQLGNRYIDISDGTTHLQCRRAEGIPFDLDSAIPKQFQEAFYLRPDEFLGELTYLKDLTSSKKITVRFCGGNLLTQVKDCRHQTKIQVDGQSEMTIGFELSYMVDALRQFKGESRVLMKLTTPVSPIVLEAEGRSDHALVLPVRPQYLPAA